MALDQVLEDATPERSVSRVLLPATFAISTPRSGRLGRSRSPSLSERSRSEASPSARSLSPQDRLPRDPRERRATEGERVV